MPVQRQISNWESATIKEGSTLENALNCINKAGLQICLVVTTSYKLKGIVTDSDIRKALLKGVNLETNINKIMNNSPVIVPPDIQEKEAENLMLLNHIFHLPIVDKKGKLIGLHVTEQLRFNSPREESIMIMAGGKGKRLLPLTANTPKPMLPLDGKPILEHIINKAKSEGFYKIILSINYLADQIIEYFGDGSNFGVEINFLKEETPLGTAGCIANLPDSKKESPLIVTNGDVITDLSFSDLIKFNSSNKSDATMAVRAHKWQCPYGVIKSNGHKLVSLEEKPIYIHQVNAGIYVLMPSIMNILKTNKYCDMTDLLLEAKNKGLSINIFPLHENWIDIGKHEDYLKAQKIKLNKHNF